MSRIVILENFAFVGELGQDWGTDWIAVPASFQNWQLVIVVKSLIAGSGLDVRFQTTWDTDAAVTAWFVPVLNATGTTVIDVGSDVGPMVRLFFRPTSTSGLVFSCYLTPKSE